MSVNLLPCSGGPGGSPMSTEPTRPPARTEASTDSLARLFWKLSALACLAALMFLALRLEDLVPRSIPSEFKVSHRSGVAGAEHAVYRLREDQDSPATVTLKTTGQTVRGFVT